MFGFGLGRAIGSALAGGASWSPLALFAAGEKGVWFDPSDFSSMFQDSAGTTPVTAVGDPVGRINDKSGNGNHATQATPGSRPLLQQDGAGKYYLDFDGADDGLATAAIDFTATDKMTVCAGVRKGSDAADGCILNIGDPSSSEAGSFRVDAPGSSTVTKYQFASRGTATSVPFTTSATYNAPHSGVITAVAAIASDTAELRINGALVNSQATNQGTGNYGNYSLYIGRRIGASDPFNGRIYQLVVRGAATASLTELETYVNSKTGAY